MTYVYKHLCNQRHTWFQTIDKIYFCLMCCKLYSVGFA